MPERRSYGKSPEAVAVLGVAGASGAIQTAVGQIPPSVSEVVSTPVGIAWGVLFTLGALASLAGLYWPGRTAHDEETGYIVELGGRIALTLTSLGYIVALLAYGSLTSGGLTVALVSAVCLSSAWRIMQLTLKLRRWRENLDMIRKAGRP